MFTALSSSFVSLHGTCILYIICVIFYHVISVDHVVSFCDDVISCDHMLLYNKHLCPKKKLAFWVMKKYAMISMAYFTMKIIYLSLICDFNKMLKTLCLRMNWLLILIHSTCLSFSLTILISMTCDKSYFIKKSYVNEL